MVICKFFQQNTCRFGDKCKNEHIDVKHLIKTDVESALNGKQWPFSCFGPFKDKPCIPNFNEDQSYEEMRFLCYEARQKNFFNQFHQQFTEKALESQNKMKALLQFSPQVVDVVTRLYDTPVENAVRPTNNPFGMGGTTAGSDASSIFGKPNTAVGGSSNIFGGGSGGAGVGGGIFGSSTTNTGNFFGGGVGGGGVTQNASIFGGGNQHQQQTGTSIFGNQTMTKPANSFFGGGTQNSIFGQNQTAPPSGGGGGLFAQAMQQTNTAVGAAGGGGGLFAQAAQQMQPNQGFGLFSQAAQKQAPTSVFGQQNPFVAQQQQQQQQNQQQQQLNTGIFGQQQGAAPTAGNMFSQAAQMQNQQMAGNSPFNVGAAPNQNIFAQAMQQQQQQQNQQFPQPSNIFGQAAQQQSAPQMGQQALPPQQGGFFQQAMQQQPQQFVQQQQQQAPFYPQPVGGAANSTTYSRLEDLTEAEIEAFKADSFEPGKIPISPPPRELCN